jgi:sortase family protein
VVRGSAGAERPRRPGRRPATAALVALSVLLAGSGLALLVLARGGSRPGPPAPVVSSAGASPSATVPAEVRASALPRSRPVRIVVPAIGVDARLSVVGLTADGTIETPSLGRDSPPAWYRYLPTPGENGPAVIIGHVDSARWGPAVFYRLGELGPGDRITIIRRDGRPAVFAVQSVVSVPSRGSRAGRCTGRSRIRPCG